MTFTADARWLVFVADHTADQFDDGYHLHSVYTEPFEFEDGTLALNTASEFGATTHFISDTPLDSIVIPAAGSGVSDVPDVIAVAQGACGPDRRALLGIGHEDAPVTLMDVPSRPIGFLSVDDTTATVVVATSDDGCNGPWDLHEVVVDLETSDTSASAAVADVDAAAVHAVLPTVDITLSGVLIEPFA